MCDLVHIEDGQKYTIERLNKYMYVKVRLLMQGAELPNDSTRYKLFKMLIFGLIRQGTGLGNGDIITPFQFSRIQNSSFGSYIDIAT